MSPLKRKFTPEQYETIARMIKNRIEDKIREESEPGPILDEIEKLIEEIKERAFIVSQTEEQKELIISNLIVAYYLNKLERKL
jgi:hypothetical protein